MLVAMGLLLVSAVLPASPFLDSSLRISVAAPLSRSFVMSHDGKVVGASLEGRGSRWYYVIAGNDATDGDISEVGQQLPNWAVSPTPGIVEVSVVVGWPLPTLEYCERLSLTEFEARKDTQAVAGRIAKSAVVDQMPIPNGIITSNILLFWAVLCGLSWSVVAVSSRLRRCRRKNACVACGYPKVGWKDKICPECGSGTQKVMSES